MFLSDGSLSMFGSKYSSLSRLKGKGEGVLGTTLKTVETVGSAFGMAYSNGRYATPGKDHVEVMKDVPADLTGGLLLLGASMMGVFGEYDEHGSNLADGLLSCYAVRVGAKLGAEARLKDPAAPAVKGEFHAAVPRSQVGMPDLSWAR